MENNQLTEQPEQPDECCANCGNPAFLKEYPTKLCSECREKFIKFPVPKWLWLFAAALGVILLFSLFSVPKNILAGIALEKGKKAEKQHRFFTAQKEFEEVVEKQPSYIEAESHLMKAAFYNMDFVTFGKALKALEKKDIDDRELFAELDQLITKSRNYFPGDSLRQITDKYDSLKAELPGNILLSYIIKNDSDICAKMIYASILYDKKNYTSCDSVIHKILKTDADFVPGLRLLASSEREAGNYQESITCCEKLLDINSEYSYAIASKARTFLKMKKDKDALKLALQAHGMDKKDGYSIATLALAYHFNGNIGKRDEIINNSKKDSLLSVYMSYALDVINNKEKFRD